MSHPSSLRRDLLKGSAAAAAMTGTFGASIMMVDRQ